ncbi:helix-turn-helix domain-containing protein [Acidisphaera sp. L21]|uniref:helix-turn-helix domain-containing protein n=1 Tax=Acidisphaera sp. L21 TaxID=1641851 RepID=UPI00131E0159
MGPNTPDSDGDIPGRSVDRHVGARLRARRLANGLAVKTIAQTLGVTEERVSQWEDGFYRVPAHHLLAVSHLLSCPLGVFFEGFPAAGSPEDEIEPTESQINWLFHRYSGAKH